jgi:hypothetical protein
VLVGRSSSHFTRVARLLAHELEVEHDFSPVYEIGSTDAGVLLFCYGEHLGFREILSIAGHPRLTAFVAEWGRRPSALATPYRFDRPG